MENFTLWITLATQICTLIVSVAAVIKVTQTHKLVNSQMEEFKVLIAKSSKAEGVLQEVDRGKL